MPQQGLNPRQRKFCREYLSCGNATKAAIAAGYESEWIDKYAFRLLRKSRVKAYLAELREQASVKEEITPERVIRELGILAFSDITNYDVNTQGELTLKPKVQRGATRAVQSVTFDEHIVEGRDGSVTTRRKKSVKVHEKSSSLDKLCKHLGIALPKEMTPFEALVSAIPPELIPAMQAAMAKKLSEKKPE